MKRFFIILTILFITTIVTFSATLYFGQPKLLKYEFKWIQPTKMGATPVTHFQIGMCDAGAFNEQTINTQIIPAVGENKFTLNLLTTAFPTKNGIKEIYIRSKNDAGWSRWAYISHEFFVVPPEAPANLQLISE